MKNVRFESKKLRDSAKNQSCNLRVVGVCNGNPETTVLAHVNVLGSAMGAKTHDFSACFCCSDCHTWLDQNKGSEEDRLYYTRRAIVETLEYWFNNGFIGVLRK